MISRNGSWTATDSLGQKLQRYYPGAKIGRLCRAEPPAVAREICFLMSIGQFDRIDFLNLSPIGKAWRYEGINMTRAGGKRDRLKAEGDPGYIYMVQAGTRFKIGKSTSKTYRLAAAKTWLPDLNVVGVKPFWEVTWVERCLHEGFARCWYAGEWFEPTDEGYRSVLVDGFTAFSDHDRDINSREFIYWFNGDGMAEFCRERNSQGLGVRKFQRQESEVAMPSPPRKPRLKLYRQKTTADLFD